MAQPQSQIPPRAFSVPQHSPSPGPPQSGYALPPNKRVRTDGPGSQPGSPYIASPYAASPAAAGSPPANAASPTYTSTPPVSGSYATPYTNGHGAASLSLPDASAGATPPNSMLQPATSSMHQYTTAMMAPISLAAPPAAANVMGPPQRPAERPTKDYEYDVTDSLAGTGIDLRAEEQYMSELYSHALDTNSDARTGFARHPAGPKATFYGAGPASQPLGPTMAQNQDQFAAKAAEQAWAESSMRLAVQRTQEIHDPFLMVALLHRRAEKIAREHHLDLNLDMKSSNQTMGSFIPHDSFLVDQLALMSIATKQRLCELVEEAGIVATNRQKTSHGELPEEWAPAAAPMNAEPLEPIEEACETTDKAGVEDPGTNPLKRSADAADLGDKPMPIKKLAKIAPNMTLSMRERARQEREWEEARLRKRQRRKEGVADVGTAASRPGSVAPGTPGSVAPEPEKAMTKKEQKKSQALKAAEADSHANQNLTSSMFAGLGGKGGLFGKKKTGRTYDWMNVGRGGSGTNTPPRATLGSRGPNGAPGTVAAANQPLTTEGRNRLGTWREDKEKGKNIQLRDWVTVLERDGREPKALSLAYVHLDTSQPK